MAIKNTLNCIGEIQLSDGSTYTLKSDEVLINSALYKKKDLEISIQNLGADDDDDVKVSIRKRDGLSGLPANFVKYDEWNINGVNQTSLSECVENITTCIFYEASSTLSIPTTVSTYAEINAQGIYYLDTVDGNHQIGIYHRLEDGTIIFQTGELIKIINTFDTSKSGWIIKGNEPFNINIGQNAMALSQASSAQGDDSVAIGYASKSMRNRSVTIGSYAEALGNKSTASGYATKAINPLQYVLGAYNKGVSPDTSFEIGIGTGIAVSQRKNLLEGYWDGTLNTPENTIAKINTRGSKALITKEYVDNAIPQTPKNIDISSNFTAISSQYDYEISILSDVTLTLNENLMENFRLSLQTMGGILTIESGANCSLRKQDGTVAQTVTLQDGKSLTIGKKDGTNVFNIIGDID